MDKQALRALVRARKRAMTVREIADRSAVLTESLLASEAYRRCTALYGYLSYNQEVRTAAILEQALRDGKQVAVPKVYGDTMKFILLPELCRVAPGRFGIPEPVADGPEAQEAEALVLVPGLAFDPMGHRIGYGGGYYDRFLEREPHHPTIALCYSFQVFPALETDPHDQPVDLVLWA